MNNISERLSDLKLRLLLACLIIWRFFNYRGFAMLTEAVGCSFLWISWILNRCYSYYLYIWITAQIQITLWVIIKVGSICIHTSMLLQQSCHLLQIEIPLFLSVNFGKSSLVKVLWLHYEKLFSPSHSSSRATVLAVTGHVVFYCISVSAVASISELPELVHRFIFRIASSHEREQSLFDWIWISKEASDIFCVWSCTASTVAPDAEFLFQLSLHLMCALCSASAIGKDAWTMYYAEVM